MKKLLLILFVGVVQIGFGQDLAKGLNLESISETWYNQKNNYYIQFKGDSLFVTMKMIHNETKDEFYETIKYNLKKNKNTLTIISEKYWTTGIRFWGLKYRGTYEVELHKNSKIIMNLIKMNHKNWNIVVHTFGENNIEYTESSNEEVEKLNPIRFF